MLIKLLVCTKFNIYLIIVKHDVAAYAVLLHREEGRESLLIMKKMSVIASGDEVIKNLEHYLELRKFRSIQVNYSAGEITAERKKFIFGKRNIINLKIIRVNDVITNVELMINPGMKERTIFEDQLEDKLRDKMYPYL